MATDLDLLRDYVQDRSEGAFAGLVQRHINLVYSAALRESRGDASLAEDITQAVFAELARKGSSLVRHPALAGWLYTCVRRMTANVRRTDDRRRRREQEVQTMNELRDTSDPVWRQVQPVLDDVMHQLSESDRAAVVLRFFEDRSLKEVGLALGINENAARMRVDRALEKLQTLLAKRGVTSTVSGLAAAMTIGAVVSAPSGLAANVATGALATATTTTSVALLKIMTMTKLKAGLISAAAVAGIATPLVLQHQSHVKLREDNQALTRQVNQLTADNARLSDRVRQANGFQTLSKEQLSELLKLRNEVGMLRRQTNGLEKLREENRRLQASPAGAGHRAEPSDSYPAAEQEKGVGIAKLNYARNWLLALHLYASENQEQFPAGLDQALPYLPDEAKSEHNLKPGEFLPYTPKYGLTPDQYEIVYQGTLTAITDAPSVIVLREKQAWPREKGGWNRTYGFADGHSEIHHSPDGDFDAWEQQHKAPLSPSQTATGK